MKKLIILMLVLCLSVTAFASCSDKPNENGNGTTAPVVQGTPAPNDPQTPPVEEDLFPDKDLDGEEINILMSAEMKQYCYSEETGISQVSDAIYDTYATIEEKYNVVFLFDFESSQGKNTAKFNAKVENGVLSGYGKGYDLIMGQMHSVGLASSGYYKNLANVDSIRYDAEYYYKSINDSATVVGQRYAMAGAYNMDKVTMGIVCFFNKSLHDDFFSGTEYGDLYDMVENKKWTYDAMSKMSLAVQEEDGDGEWNEKDRYGLIGTGTGMAALTSSGVVFVTKNSDEDFSISFYNDQTTTIYASYLDFFNKDYVKVDGTYNNESLFTSGNALFYSSHTNRLIVMNGMASFKIGVLPFPLYNEQQPEYRTFVNRSEMIFVPINADIEIAATIMEYMNYLFLEDVVTAYWDQSLTSRFAADPIDAEMLELARSCVFEDFGLTYTSVLDYFSASAGNNLMTGVELAGWWEGVEGTVREKITALVEEYEILATKGY